MMTGIKPDPDRLAVITVSISHSGHPSSVMVEVEGTPNKGMLIARFGASFPNRHNNSDVLNIWVLKGDAKESMMVIRPGSDRFDQLARFLKHSIEWKQTHPRIT